MYIYTYTYIHIHKHIHRYIYIYICTSIYVYMVVSSMVEDNLVFFFFKGDNHCLPQHMGDGFSWVIIMTLMTLGKP